DCGESLGKAENPFFVAAWYSFAAHVYRMFAPDANFTKELEDAAQKYAGIRMEYEKGLDTPIYEIEEFEVHDLDLPDIVNEIVNSDGEHRLPE
ncbi:hypothetical protein C5B91_21120, partial [Haloferax sp. Atlit-10N]|uniref:hypothetical protein n=1 Tax=Haloferax sp. Atlit-10N TaxID=2077204 RepID=UPI000E3979AF